MVYEVDMKVTEHYIIDIFWKISIYLLYITFKHNMFNAQISGILSLAPMSDTI